MSREEEKCLSGCIDNICDNFDVAGVRFSAPLIDRGQHDHYIMFMDTVASIVFTRTEIVKCIEKSGVRSKEDYRALRNLIKLRLLDAARSLKCLAEETAKNLGGKI